MKRNAIVLGVLVAVAASCAQTENAAVPADALINNESFVAINKPAEAATAMIRVGGAQGASSGPVNPVQGAGTNDFYLAVSKKSLGDRWFLSGFVKQYYPGDGVPADNAVQSLGTRVVSFQVQNGKLFMFDVSDGRKSSNLFDPQVLVEAYPLVTNYAPFQALANHDNYVLIDPSAGLNKFQASANLYTDSYLAPTGAPNFNVGLAFMQNFRKIADGVTYEMVFSGNGLVDDGAGNQSTYYAAGTLGVALRKYAESKNYTPTAYPYTGDYYFTSDYKLVPGGATATAAHFAIYKGMTPIVYYITPDVAMWDAMYPKAKLIDAIKEGVENWNDVFGFKALEARVTTDATIVGEDDKNVIEIDTDPSAGYAFANWRSNPNTGETRGASVYIGGAWVTSNPYTPATATSGSNGAPAPSTSAMPKPHKVSLTWAPLEANPACVMWAPQFQMQPVADDTTGGTTAAPDPDQQFHNYIAHVITHEVGHTLGLRHNFKGSLVPPSSSVMDYLTNADSALMAKPGEYDRQAIAYLYGMTTDEPNKLPFCTDDGVASDPECAVFDTSADPLNDDIGPYITHLINLEFKYGWGNYGLLDNAFNYWINGLLGFAVAASSPDLAVQAYNTAMGKSVIGTQAQTATYAATVDALAHTVLARLYLDSPMVRGYIEANPVYPEVNAAAIADLSSILMNGTSVYTFDTRRAAVDILKVMQSEAALNALRDARSRVAAAEAALSPDVQALTDDLLARMDRAMSPYFDN